MVIRPAQPETPKVSTVNPEDLSSSGFIGHRQFIFLLSWVTLFLLVIFFLIFDPLNLFVSSKAQPNTEQLALIDQIIVEVANPPTDYLEQIDRASWTVRKTDILDGDGDPDTEYTGLKDVRDAIVAGQFNTAKKGMNQSLFRRLSDPMQTEEGISEQKEIIEGDRLNELDPERKFFEPTHSAGIVASARLNAVLAFLKLYYSL